jgi:tRNA-dihydrouridine synthase B
MHIGSISLRNNFALAPMAGLTDVPFRTLAWQMGAGHMVSEMVSSKPELWDTGKSRLRRIPVASAHPIAVQIAGSEPAVMAESARRLAGEGVEVIDINFGCPAKKVCRKSAGSALLNDIELIERIVACVADAVPIPVTIKTRVGLTPQDNAGVAAAQAAQRAGAQMIVVHGRSRACHFRGHASYEKVREVCDSVAIPVLVNGDIESLSSAEHALEVSQAAGVMIGRGAFGRPWLFRELLGMAPLTEQQKWQIIEDHVCHTHDFYGIQLGVRMIRKHLKAYFAELRVGVMGDECLKLTSAQEQLDCIRRIAEGAQKTNRDIRHAA